MTVQCHPEHQDDCSKDFMLKCLLPHHLPDWSFFCVDCCNWHTACSTQKSCELGFGSFVSLCCQGRGKQQKDSQAVILTGVS